MTRIFGHGGLRLVLLSLLEDGPRHGYDLIGALEERFWGMYRPSSGTVYPRLAALEDEGLIVSEEVDARRVYRITDAGRAELARRRSDLEETVATATGTVRAAMDDLQADIRATVAGVQAEVEGLVAQVWRQTAGASTTRQAATEARPGAGDAARQAWRDSEEASRRALADAKRVRRAADAAAAAAGAAAGAVAGVRPELDDLATDVSTWAAEAVEQLRRHLPDDRQRERLRAALDEARRAFVEAMAGGGRPAAHAPGSATDPAPAGPEPGPAAPGDQAPMDGSDGTTEPGAR